MDRGRTKLPNTSSRLIAMAITLLHSPQAVQEHMRCSNEEFEAYRSGAKEPPWQELARLIDLIVSEQSRVIQKNRDLLAEIRRKS